VFYGILLKIELNQSQSLLYIQRFYVTNYQMVILSLLGAISGLFQVFGFMMATTESFSDSGQEKLRDLGSKDRIMQKSEEIAQNFEYEEREINAYPMSFKVYPMEVTDMNTTTTK
jgi:hypothetical protein